MREYLLQALAKLYEMEALLEQLLAPDCPNVPSLENVEIWIKGQLQKY